MRTTNLLRKFNANQTNSYITIGYQILEIFTGYVAVIYANIVTQR